jgi:hypothetical protein
MELIINIYNNISCLLFYHWQNTDYQLNFNFSSFLNFKILMSQHLQSKFRNNPLLVKAEVGKSKLLGHKIPTGDFVFGKPSNSSQHGVKESKIK